MKILTGTYKGRNIFMPADVRPTQNIARKAVIDILGQDVSGLDCLELFAGSGAVGIEMLSSGAKQVTFVEKLPQALKVIRENLERLNLENHSVYHILAKDSFAAIKEFHARGRKFDLIFADPPYGRQLAKKTLMILGRYDIIQPNCIVVVQSDVREELPAKLGPFLKFKQRKYGQTFLAFFSYKRPTEKE